MFRSVSELPDDGFATALARIGDFDADGADDLAIGVPGDDTKGTDAGKVLVLSGRGGEVLRTYFGESAGARFGAAVSGARDIAFDGFDRLVVGAPGHEGERGAVYVYGGGKRALEFRLLGEQPGEHLGACVADALDADNDGKFDIAVGSPGFDGASGEDAGRVLVISGRSKPSRPVLLNELEGSIAWERAGTSLAAIESAAPGMFHAIAVGAPGGVRPGTDARTGVVRVYSAKTWDPMYVLSGREEGAGFGHAVTSAGQWRPIDGSADLAVASRAPGCAVRVYSGQTGDELASIPSPFADVRFGASLAGSPDLSGDGVGDLVIGSVREDGGDAESPPMTAWIVSGATKAVEHAVVPARDGDALGAAVAATGNFMADGLASLAIAGRDAAGAGLVQAYSTASSKP